MGRGTHHLCGRAKRPPRGLAGTDPDTVDGFGVDDLPAQAPLPLPQECGRLPANSVLRCSESHHPAEKSPPGWGIMGGQLNMPVNRGGRVPQ